MYKIKTNNNFFLRHIFDLFRSKTSLLLKKQDLNDYVIN